MHKFFRILGIISLSIILFILCFTLFLIIKFRTWEQSFVEGLDKNNLVSEGIDLSDTLAEKTEAYILSEDDTNYITLTSQEVSSIVYSTLSDITSESGLEVTHVYVQPDNSIWKVCAKGELVDINIHSWLCVDINKDDMQTAQLYLSEIELQGIRISKIYPKAITMANQGIADALTTANENGFVGRVLENIELLDSEIVIKGSIW